MYFLVDSSVVVAYYLPARTRSRRAARAIELIIDSNRTNVRSDFFYIPNFCIAEVFDAFTKHALSKWNRHVKPYGTLDKRVYKSLVRQFEKDIHNGKFFYHCELNRYHILSSHLVSPVDHYYCLSKRKNKSRATPAGTLDHLIVAMGIQLGRIHGPKNVCILTADSRLGKVLERCKSNIPQATVRKLQFVIGSRVTGIEFSSEIFPRHLELGSSTREELRSVFGEWPVRVNGRPSVYRNVE